MSSTPSSHLPLDRSPIIQVHFNWPPAASRIRRMTGQTLVVSGAGRRVSGAHADAVIQPCRSRFAGP